MPGFGFSLMLWKCVMIWDFAPERSVNRVASGRAVGFQAVPPVLVGKASIALATEGVADQVRRVSCRYCNKARSGWGRDLRRRKGDCAEGTCEHESGHEQAPNSRSLSCLLTKDEAHLLVLQFSVLFQRLETVEVVKTHD